MKQATIAAEEDDRRMMITEEMEMEIIDAFDLQGLRHISVSQHAVSWRLHSIYLGDLTIFTSSTATSPSIAGLPCCIQRKVALVRCHSMRRQYDTYDCNSIVMIDPYARIARQSRDIRRSSLVCVISIARPSCV